MDKREQLVNEWIIDYGVDVRYPGDWILLSDEDICEAHQAALKVKEFIEEKMGR